VLTICIHFGSVYLCSCYQNVKSNTFDRTFQNS